MEDKNEIEISSDEETETSPDKKQKISMKNKESNEEDKETRKNKDDEFDTTELTTAMIKALEEMEENANKENDEMEIDEEQKKKTTQKNITGGKKYEASEKSTKGEQDKSNGGTRTSANQSKIELTADGETAQDIMKKRGVTLTEDKVLRKTKMKFEFNIDKNTLTFTIRKTVQL